MRRTLGKGLSQLIADQYESSTNEIPVDSIEPNKRQPRKVFDEEALEELADSIREHGVVQPLVVRPVSEGRYELIAGERRLRAAKLAGLHAVPVTVRSANEQASLELALIENIQREDIGALECALAYRHLIDEFELTQDQVAQKVGKARTSIANTLRLLRLPKNILEGLSQGKITEGHARALLQVEDQALQLALYEKIVSSGLSVRDVERIAQGHTQKRAKASSAKKDVPLDPNWVPLQDALSTYLGTQVKMQKTDHGGKIQIEFYSDDDLERIMDVLGISL